MANLIKELQLRYSPEGGSPRQVSHDYFAMFALWRAEGSGGDGGATSIGRSRLVDDVFRQVAEAMGLKYAEGRQLAGREVIKKDIGQLNHYLKMEDWMNFHGVVKDILRKTVVSTRFQELSKMETNPKAHLDDFSRMIRELVRSSRVLPDAPGASTKSEPEPAYKQFDKPLTAPPAALSPELPMKGAQMHLPLKPQEKIPVPEHVPENTAHHCNQLIHQTLFRFVGFFGTRDPNSGNGLFPQLQETRMECRYLHS